jgi:hypothetical protein
MAAELGSGRFLMRWWSRWMTGSLAAGFTMFLVGTAFHLCAGPRTFALHAY